MPYTNVEFYGKADFDPKNVGRGLWAYLLDSTDPNHTLGLILLDHTVRWVALVPESPNTGGTSSGSTNSGSTTSGETNSSAPTTSETEVTDNGNGSKENTVPARE